MKKVLFYFYLLCFVLFFGVGMVVLFDLDENIGFIVLAQLVWGPIAIIHCFYKFVTTIRRESKFRNLYTISFVITVLYFVLLSLISSVGIHIDMLAEDILFTIGIVIIPWLMLAYFTYILYLDQKEETTPID